MNMKKSILVASLALSTSFGVYANPEVDPAFTPAGNNGEGQHWGIYQRSQAGDNQSYINMQNTDHNSVRVVQGASGNDGNRSEIQMTQTDHATSNKILVEQMGGAKGDSYIKLTGDSRNNDFHVKQGGTYNDSWVGADNSDFNVAYVEQYGNDSYSRVSLINSNSNDNTSAITGGSAQGIYVSQTGSEYSSMVLNSSHNNSVHVIQR